MTNFKCKVDDLNGQAREEDGLEREKVEAEKLEAQEAMTRADMERIKEDAEIFITDLSTMSSLVSAWYVLNQQHILREMGLPRMRQKR